MTRRIVAPSLRALGLALLVLVAAAPAVASAGVAQPLPAYTEQEVRLVTAAGDTLAGALTLPRAPGRREPAVLLISGSGPNDRDHRFEWLDYRGFRELADTLGRRGVAVLRLDDRGHGRSTGLGGSATTTAERAQDMHAALRFLRRHPRIDPTRVALIGLSEGGLIAAMMAAADARVAAVVLMAAPASPAMDLVDHWARYAADRSAAESSLRSASALYDAHRRAILDQYVGTRWWHWIRDVDPLPVVRGVRQPVLLLHGANDGNVPPEHLHRLAGVLEAAGNRHVEAHLFPGLNHLFIADPDGRESRFRRLPSLGMDAGVLGVIAGWITRRLRA